MELALQAPVAAPVSGVPRSLSRRDFLGAVAAGCIFCTSREARAQRPQSLPRFCAIDPSVDLKKYRARSTTGEPRLDRALIAELRSIVEIMPINPGFRIIDDEGSPNAFALGRTIVERTRGTVLFGIQLIRTELGLRDGGYAVAGIAAHECAHVYQFFSRYGELLRRDQKNVRVMELHADFLAGYYLGRDKASEIDIEAFARSLFGKGDLAFNDPNHHGTPEERVEAMEKGYALADSRRSFDQIAELGARHVLS